MTWEARAIPRSELASIERRLREKALHVLSIHEQPDVVIVAQPGGAIGGVSIIIGPHDTIYEEEKTPTPVLEPEDDPEDERGDEEE